MSLCRNCRSADARATKALCPACYMHQRRHGTDRSEMAVIRHNEKKLERELAERWR
jgi:hypothetical protein